MIHEKKISLNQLFCLVVLTQVGVHVLSIPYAESRNSGSDSWMSVLLAGIIAQVVILIIYFLGKRFENTSFPQYIFEIVGKPLGAVVNVIVALYCLESVIIVIVSYADVLNRWVLFETPWFVIIALSCFLAAFIASSPLRAIATITQTILIMFFICFIIIIISGVGHGDVRHFFPMGNNGFGAIIRDTIPAFWAYAGYELLLYVFPYVRRKKNKEILITMSLANGFTTFFYLMISLIVLYNFDEKQLAIIAEPMVFILRVFQWPIVQSLDILFMTIWFSVTTVTAYVYLFLAARYIAFIKVKEISMHYKIVWFSIGICLVIGSWNSDRTWILQFSDFHNKTTILIIVLFPTLFLLISKIRGKGTSL